MTFSLICAIVALVGGVIIGGKWIVECYKVVKEN